jgi:hypothetical protein
MTPRPFVVHHSARALDLLAAAIQAAAATGRRADAIRAAQVIERGLLWYADGFGESRRLLKVMGELRCATILPLTVWFAVDVIRWEVQVSRYRFATRRLRGNGSP